MIRHYRLPLIKKTILTCLIFTGSVFSQTELVLKNSFIQKYRNQVTIDVKFYVDKPHQRPNRAVDDADLHIAGRATEVGLPMVAEIMNAATEKPTVDFVKSSAGKSDPIKMSGAWRLWFEHPGSKPHIQGKNVPKATSTNPDHVFEIHPITSIEDTDLRQTLTPISGYDPYDYTVFDKFDRKAFEIIPGKKTTTIITKKSFYNYVDFIMELTDEDQKVVKDGRFVMANVVDEHRKFVVGDIRMVFVKGSKPEELVKTLGPSDTLRVLGTPRINLEEVSRRITQSKTNKNVLTYTLPYEMIIVGVYR